MARDGKKPRSVCCRNGRCRDGWPACDGVKWAACSRDDNGIAYYGTFNFNSSELKHTPPA
eukprot:scaffold113127_cov18-Prasinocladus_malaysianus.AAC.1